MIDSTIFGVPAEIRTGNLAILLASKYLVKQNSNQSLNQLITQSPNIFLLLSTYFCSLILWFYSSYCILDYSSSTQWFSPFLSHVLSPFSRSLNSSLNAFLIDYDHLENHKSCIRSLLLTCIIFP